MGGDGGVSECSWQVYLREGVGEIVIFDLHFHIYDFVQYN